MSGAALAGASFFFASLIRAGAAFFASLSRAGAAFFASLAAAAFFASLSLAGAAFFASLAAAAFFAGESFSFTFARTTFLSALPFFSLGKAARFDGAGRRVGAAFFATVRFRATLLAATFRVWSLARAGADFLAEAREPPGRRAGFWTFLPDFLLSFRVFFAAMGPRSICRRSLGSLAIP